jgi:hypothetical protein
MHICISSKPASFTLKNMWSGDRDGFNWGSTRFDSDRPRSIYGSTVLRWALAASSFSWSFHTDGRIPWTRDQPIARPLPTYRTAQTQNKRTETSIPWVGSEPTIPVFERAKTARPLWSAPRSKHLYNLQAEVPVRLPEYVASFATVIKYSQQIKL